MGAYTRQPYRGHSQDAPRVIAFLSEINRHPRFVADYYTGDFVWRSFRAPEASSRESIALWENASGQIAGIGFYDAANRIFRKRATRDMYGNQIIVRCEVVIFIGKSVG